MGTLFKNLLEYSRSDYYPFHMPGHKRNNITQASPYQYDITEIDGFDNLHEPEGIIRIAMDDAAKLYCTNKTYFMVNGSSGGILAAIHSVTKRNGKVLVARNCHKSVYNAMELRELMPVYLYPSYIEKFGINGGIAPEDVETELKDNPDIQAVIITSPTYEGIVSDVKKIAQIVHKYHIPLIVDEAHGAHFSMHEKFPESAVIQGADITIQSMHKTLPALTQTALLHVKGNIVDSRQIEKYLSVFQTSSPSYVLMASMDECLNQLKQDGVRMFNEYVSRMETVQEHCKKLTHIKVVTPDIKKEENVFDFDLSKLVISVRGTGYSGVQLYKELLEKYHLQMEMAAGDYVIAMTSLMDSEDGLLRLFKALVEIDRNIRVYGMKSFFINGSEFKVEKAVVIKGIAAAQEAGKESLRFTDAQGKISAEYIYMYPPGSPILVPGEMITGDVISIVKKYKGAGLEIHGPEDKSLEKIKVLKEEFKALKFKTVM